MFGDFYNKNQGKEESQWDVKADKDGDSDGDSDSVTDFFFSENLHDSSSLI